MPKPDSKSYISIRLMQEALAEVDNPRAREQELKERAKADVRQRMFFPDASNAPNVSYVVRISQNYRASQQA